MGASITLAGESLISQKQAARQTVEVSTFILAKVPGLDTTLPVDRSAGVPDANLIVHTTPVTREGYLATNKVVYSLMLGTDIGDFDFNWMGLVTAEGVLLIAAYVPLQQKRREIPPLQAGNNLTRNIVWEYDGAQSLSGITVPASTWQFDFTADFTAINTQLAELKTELGKKVDLETWTPPQAVSLDGPVLVYPGSTNTYKITDYNRFSVFTASTTLGTVSVAADVLTLVIPTVAAAGLLTLEVLRDGNKASFKLPVGAASIVPPTITSPANLATGVALDLVLTATAFEVFPTAFDHQVSRRWQIATDEAFTQIVFDKTSTTALTSIRPTEYDFLLPPGKRLYARTYDIGATLQSEKSATVVFNTATTYIRRPAITFPIDGAQNVSTGVTLLSDAFSVYGGNDTQVGSRFQICTAADGTGVVFDSGWVTSGFTSYKPASNLATITQFYGRVKYKGQALGETEWSPLVGFKTANKLQGVYKALNGGATARSNHAMAALDGKIYVVGGSDSSGTLSDLWRYDPATNAWLQLPNMPVPRLYHTMVAMAGKLYVFGGSPTGSQFVNDIYTYDPVQNKWAQVVVTSANPPSVRYGHIAKVINGKMYIYGGHTGMGYLNDLWVFDPTARTWTALQGDSPARYSSTAGVIAGELYVAIGAQESTGSASRLSKYNVTTNTWTPLKSMPYSARLWATGEAASEKLYVFGGSSNAGELLEFDPQTGEWTQLPANPSGTRAWATTCELNGKLYVFGGTNGAALNSLFSIE